MLRWTLLASFRTGPGNEARTLLLVMGPGSAVQFDKLFKHILQSASNGVPVVSCPVM